MIDGEAGTAQVRASVNGGAPVTVGVSNVFPGDVQLIQAGSSTVVHRKTVETIGELERSQFAKLEAQQTANNAAAEKLLSLMERKTPTGWLRTLTAKMKFYVFGGKYFHGIDLQPILSESDPTVQTYYVDIATGSDTNPGTAAAPLKSLKFAADRIGSGGRGIIKAKGGLYPYDQAFRGIMGGAVIQIVSWDGQPVVSSRHTPGLIWTLDTGTTYTSPVAAIVAGVVDTTILTADGDYTPLKPAASAVLCRTTPGSWFFSAPTLYVNTSDGRVPDDTIRAYRTSADTSDAFSLNMASNGQVLYMQDLHLEGGRNLFRLGSTNAAHTFTSYARRCHTKYASDTGDIAAGAGLHIRQDCISARNGGDGWNWQPSGFGGEPCLALELDCIGRGNGWSPSLAGTSNGSSSHGADVIRVNSVYHHNRDRTVHDIQQGRASRSWNLGCDARDSQLGAANWANGINAADTSIMWLDGCKSSGGPVDIEVTAAAKVFTSGFTGAGVNTGAGTVAAYTP